MVRPAVALILALIASACDESIIIPGDAPGLMTIVAGVGDSIGSRVDAFARRTKLTEPGGVAFHDATGTLYVADRASSVTAGGVTRKVARLFAVRSDGSITLLLDAADCPSTCPQSVHSIVVTAAGQLLFTDPIGQRVFRLQPGSTPEVLAGTGASGDSPDGTTAGSAALRGPAGIAVDRAGRVVFTEQQGERIRAIELDGTLATIAGTGKRGGSGDGGPALEATFAGPSGLALSSSGVLYVADRLNGRIRSVSLETGVVVTIAGTSSGFGGDGGPAEIARLNQPESLALSGDELTLFVADAGNDRVRAIRLSSGTMETFAGTGSTPYNGAGRPAGDTSLDSPRAVTTGANGLLFISDRGHSVIWRTRTVATSPLR